MIVNTKMFNEAIKKEAESQGLIPGIGGKTFKITLDRDVFKKQEFTYELFMNTFNELFNQVKTPDDTKIRGCNR